MASTTANTATRDLQVYDVAHGNKPEFISGNYYNHHEVKRAKREKTPKRQVKVFSLEKLEKARETKDERRAARQASREAARQARMIDLALGYSHKKPVKEPASVASAARRAYELVASYDKVVTA